MMLIRNAVSLLLLTVLLISSTLSLNKLRLDDFNKEKRKIEKAINSQRLSNYLIRMIMKNDGILDNTMFFLSENDFKFDNEDINYSSMQLKDDDNEFKARVFGLKWVREQSKEKSLKPYHVRLSEENITGWKAYHVLLMDEKDNYILKKVCFPQREGENFGLVIDHTKLCNETVNKIKEYKVFEKEEQEVKDSNNSESEIIKSNTKGSPVTEKIESKNEKIVLEKEINNNAAKTNITLVKEKEIKPKEKEIAVHIDEVIVKAEPKQNSVIKENPKMKVIKKTQNLKVKANENKGKDSLDKALEDLFESTKTKKKNRKSKSKGIDIADIQLRNTYNKNKENEEIISQKEDENTVNDSSYKSTKVAKESSEVEDEDLPPEQLDMKKY